MDTYYDVENTNTGGMIVNVTEKKGDDTKTFVKKFTRFTEGLDYINKSRFHEAFDALNNLGWSYAHRGKDISIEMFSPCGENLFVFVPNVTFDYTKIEAIEIMKNQFKLLYDNFDAHNHAIEKFIYSNCCTFNFNFDDHNHAIEKYQSTDFSEHTDDLSVFVEDAKAIQEIYLSAYKELDKIIDCLQNNEQYIFVHPKHQSSSRPNLNNKIANWLVEHQSVLDDLSSYCDIETEELISRLNTKQSPNIIFNNGTPFKVIMRDEESHVALLKNEVSNYYNVACNINDETGEWSNSLVYSQRLEVAKQVYANKTAETMDYVKYRTIHYLEENHPYLMYDNIQQIVDHAKVIYRSVDDEAGKRTTLEDLSEYIAELYENEEYQSNGIDYLECPVYSMSDNDILDKFYNNDYNIEDVIEEDDELEI
ncbi:hypothetical protein [Faecalibacillus intestinalis]|uniref:hypothetical protein n=1 Tax=Faecalibacillus intestinalis TaxID=1982626 RepID=UPI0035219E2C